MEPRQLKLGELVHQMDSVIQAVLEVLEAVGLVAEVRLNRMEEGMTGATTMTEGVLAPAEPRVLVIEEEGDLEVTDLEDLDLTEEVNVWWRISSSYLRKSLLHTL